MDRPHTTEMRSVQQTTERAHRLHQPAVLWWILTILWLSACPQLAAQELVLTVKTQTPKVRSQAPVPLDLNLNWNTTELLEGTLYIEIREGAERIMKYENADLAMTVGDNSLRILLPPLDLDTDEIEISASFTPPPKWGLPFDLGKHTIKLVPDWTRQVLVGMVVPEGDRSPRSAFSFIDDFQLTQFQPAADRKGRHAKELYSVDARIDAGDFPTLAANLCAFDVIFLTQDALQDLRSGERKALRRWVDAGGSAFIDVSGAVTIDESEYLNEIASRTRGENAFLPDSGGRLQPRQLVRARYGLGRVIVSTTAASELSSRQKSEAAQWLWKLTRTATTSVNRTGAWQPRQEAQRQRTPQSIPDDVQLYGGLPIGSGTVPAPYAPAPADFAPELPSSLLPTNVRTVPLPVVISLLSLFLVLVAPADWYILGKLKRRMLTWLVFPGLCVLFGTILIFMARAYVGSEDYRTAMKLVDWGDADRISRVSSIETLFTATTKPVAVRLGNELYSSVEVRDVHWVSSGATAGPSVPGSSGTAPLPGPPDANAPQDQADPSTITYYRADKTKGDSVVMDGWGFDESDSSAEDRGAFIPKITGRPPGAYFAETEVAQWTPFVARVTGFGREAKDEYKITWGDTTFNDASADPTAVVATLRAINPGSLVSVLYCDRTYGLGESPKKLRRVARFLRLAARCSADQSREIFQAVSRISPNGHGSLEDLHLLDKTNADEVLVLIAKGHGSDVFIHRRLFYKDDTSPTE